MIPGTIFIVSLYVPTDISQVEVAQAFQFVKVWESWWCLRCPWYEPTVSQFAVPQRREPPWRLWSSSQLSPPALRAPISRHSLSRSLYFSYSCFLSLLIFQSFSSCASFGRFYSFSIDRLPFTSSALCFFPSIQILIVQGPGGVRSRFGRWLPAV